MPIASGTRVGLYEVIAAVGRGGMGEVYRARDTRLGRDVALKILPETFANDPERLARFEREAQLLASLNHPHIAAIHGIEESNGMRALVLEFVDGETLADRIRRGAIPVDEAVPIARQIAEALEAAHEQGIIHRDLTPANIKLRPDGTVKVLDFGLAKLTAPVASGSGSAGASMSPTITSPALMTGVGALLGTAAYMSPEQAKGKEADKRSDIWAFGCVLFEMLTGTRVFEGEDVADTLASVLKMDPDWRRLSVAVPPSIAAVLKSALDKDPRTRLPSMSTARFLLDQSRNPTRVAEHSAEPTRWISHVRSHRRAALIAIAALLLMTATAVVTMLATRVGRITPPSVVRLPLPLAADEVFSGTALGVVALSRDGSQLAYVANRALYVRRLSDTVSRRIVDPAEDGTIYSPVFSPDGDSIAFMTGAFPVGVTIRSTSVKGGVTSLVGRVLLPLGMSWDESGIVFADTKGIYRLSSGGGTREQLIELKQGEVAQHPTLLPDGDTVLFALTSGVSDDRPALDDWRRGSIVAQSLRTHRRVTLIKGGTDAHYLPTGHLIFASEGVLYAVPFDARALQVRGKAVPVVEGVLRQSGPQSSGAAHAAISDTGVLAYVPGPVALTGLAHNLLTVTREGRNDRLPLPPGQYVGPRVSPDGKRVTVGIDDGKEANVWVYELSGVTAIRQLTFGGHNRYPVWSADGQRIAFQSDRAQPPGIFWERGDGTSAPERLTKADAESSHTPEAFSPDGKYLLFVSSRGQSNALYALNMADRTVARFSDVESLAAPAAAFSPDGKWVAYGRRDEPAGNIALFVEPFPPTGAKFRIANNGFRPLWSKNGHELFFGTRGQSWVVNVTVSPQFAFANPKELPIRRYPPLYFGEREYDELPDGRFIFAVPADSAAVIPRELQVVINWFEELRQRVPPGR